MPTDKQIEAAAKALEKEVRLKPWAKYKDLASLALTAAEQAEPAPKAEPVATVAQICAVGQQWHSVYPQDALNNLPVGTPLYTAPPAPDERAVEALRVALDALESAREQILKDYRTWVADDTEAKPYYGQISRYDQVNAAIHEVEAALAAKEAGE